MPAVGVLGGSFNPVHWGHLHVALLAREAAGLSEVVFVPAAQPPHKRVTELAPAQHRVAMLRLALAGEPGTSLSEIELAPGGPRYTVETLVALRGARPGTEIAFIMGADSLADLPQWREPERILDEFQVIAVDRPGLSIPDSTPFSGRCRRVTGNPFAVSSTGIRRRIAEGLSVRHLVPAPVESYIAAHRLYRA